MEKIDVKKIIKMKGLKQWQVAEIYGLNEGNFSRLLRKELSGEKKEKVLAAIDKAEAEYGSKEGSLQ